MGLKIAALILLGAALVLPQSAVAQSAMCAAPDFAAALERAEHEAALPLPLRDEDLPWCATAEDPRCAPLDSHSAPVALGLRQPLAAATCDSATRFAASDDSTFTPRVGLLPRAGTSSRIERPPR